MIRTMNDLEDAKKAWQEKMDRIESRLNKAVVPDSEIETETLNAELEKLHAQNEASIAKSSAQVAEARKIIEASTAKMLDEMKWIPLKTGLWTTALLLAVILICAAFPKEASKIFRIKRSTTPTESVFLDESKEESGQPNRETSSKRNVINSKP